MLGLRLGRRGRDFILLLIYILKLLLPKFICEFYFKFFSFRLRKGLNFSYCFRPS